MKTIELYDHNKKAYDKIEDAFNSGKNIVAIRHATGTGKSYIALNLIANQNDDSKCVWVVPSTAIKEHIEETIKKEGYTRKDFSNLEIKTYQQIQRDYKNGEHLNYDLLVLDEFHHVGAPLWGEAIRKAVEENPDKKVFGMSAYTIRDRGTRYERDVALENSDELFSNAIVSEYDVADAINDKVLPEPIYRTAHFELEDEINGLVRELESKENKEERELDEIVELKELLKQVHNTDQIEKLIKDNVLPNSKCIYFCPPRSTDKLSDIDTIMYVMKEYFDKIFPNQRVTFYKTTTNYKYGKANRDAFYHNKDLAGNDVTDGIRVMFAINQYNEGVHTEGVDTVFLGRETNSDIITMEQIGRALSVGNKNEENYKLYENYSKEELIDIAKRRNIDVDESLEKEDLLSKITSPRIIDLTNHYELIKELEDSLNFGHKISRENKKPSTPNQSTSRRYKFNVKIADEDLARMIERKRKRLNGLTNYKEVKDIIEKMAQRKYMSRAERNDILANIIDLKKALKEEKDEAKKQEISNEILKAKKYLAEHYIRTVVRSSLKYTDDALELMDFIQEGTMALMETIDKTDTIDKIPIFIPLLHTRINKRFEKRILKMEEYELPTKIKENFEKLSEIEAIYEKYHVVSSIESISNNTKINIDHIKLYKAYKKKEKKERKQKELYEQQNAKIARDFYEDIEDKNLIKILMSESKEMNLGPFVVRPKEREITEKLFGINTDKEYTVEELAKEYNLTRTRIRDIKNKTLQRMRNRYYILKSREEKKIIKSIDTKKKVTDHSKKTPKEAYELLTLDVLKYSKKYGIKFGSVARYIIELNHGLSYQDERYEESPKQYFSLNDRDEIELDFMEKLFGNSKVIETVETYGIPASEFFTWLDTEAKKIKSHHQIQKKSYSEVLNSITADLLRKIDIIKLDNNFEKNATTEEREILESIDKVCKQKNKRLEDLEIHKVKIYSEPGTKPKEERQEEIQLQEKINNYFVKESQKSKKLFKEVMSQHQEFSMRNRFVDWIEKKYEIGQKEIEPNITKSKKNKHSK